MISYTLHFLGTNMLTFVSPKHEFKFYSLAATSSSFGLVSNYVLVFYILSHTKLNTVTQLETSATQRTQI